ncbi:Pre T-cell antigen receptor alpha [Apodemus speciosus]
MPHNCLANQDRQQPTGITGTPFPSLAPPITLLVDGRRHVLVVCLVLDAAPPGLDSPVWFSAGNGSALDAFTYGPSPAPDGTWTSLAQLSLPSEEMEAWEPLVCHARPGAGGQDRSTHPLQLSVEASTARTCFPEPLGGAQRQVLWLSLLRLLLFKLLLLDVLLTCSRLCVLACQHLRPPPASNSHPLSLDIGTKCDVLVEEFEEVIEDWYRNHQEEDLTEFLCANHVLKGKDTSCLAERWSGKKGDIASLGGKKSKKKRGGVKGSSGGGGSKQRKELGSLEEDARPEDDDEGVQKASPLPHSPPDEL